MIARREFLISASALGLLSACGGPKPAGVTATIAGSAGMNSGPDGLDRPLTVSLLRLRSLDAFNNADAFALQNPAVGLAADLAGLDQVAIAPGATVTKALNFEPDALFLGVVAGFRDPAGKTYKASKAIKPGSDVNVTISVGPSGLTLS